MAVWFLVPGFRFLHLAPRAVLRLPPSALLLCSMTSDSTSLRLSLLLSACSCPRWWLPGTESSAVAAAASGQPSGMTPLISSHLILVSSAFFPAQPCLASQGKGQQFIQSTCQPSPKVPSKPQLSDRRLHCQTTPLLCLAVVTCTWAVWKSGIVMDSDCLVARTLLRVARE